MQNFEDVIKEDCYYVDKTPFIEQIEESNKYFFFIRPRRFGKTLTLSMLENYYDINKKDKLMKSLASYTSGRILHQSIIHISSSTSILPRWQQDWMIIRMDWTTIVALYSISFVTSMHIFFLLIPRQDYNRSLMRYPS
jgi:hypothetical protein